MKELLIHADIVSYRVTKKTKLAEKIPEKMKEGEMKDALFVRIAVEEEDRKNPELVVKEAVNDILKVCSQIKTKNVLLYPYVHLLFGSKPASPEVAIKILKDMEDLLKKEAFNVKRAPFGYYKKFSVSCKGHPLAELSRSIAIETAGEEKEKAPRALKVEKKLKSRWYVLDMDGNLTPAENFDFSKYPSLKIFYDYETTGTREAGEEPPHVRSMRELELVDYEPGSDPGNLRWYPKGTVIKKLMEEHVTNILTNYGAMEVETPVMYDLAHPQLSKYLDRFPARQYIVKSEDKEHFLRFAACFGQYLMKHDMTISYKNLPLRLYELAHYSFRREQSGELSGLKRLRAFTMPDMHTLCKDVTQAKEEFINQFKLSMQWMQDIGLEHDVAIRSVKDFFYDNQDLSNELNKLTDKPILVELWDRRFFYFVYKFEFSINDASNKAATLSTVQIDVENAERFDINYIGEDGKKRQPLLLHSSISGSIDRNLFALLETENMKARKGKKPMLPVWLSPTQVRIIPVGEEHIELCRKWQKELTKGKVRVDIDDDEVTLNKKIRRAEKEWIPYIAVVGEKERKSNKMTIRVRGEEGKIKTINNSELIRRIGKETEGRPYRKLPLPTETSKRARFR